MPNNLMPLLFVPTLEGLSLREQLENTCPMFAYQSKGLSDGWARVDTDDSIPRPDYAIAA
jgi:hypothetical protein